MEYLQCIGSGFFITTVGGGGGPTPPFPRMDDYRVQQIVHKFTIIVPAIAMATRTD